MDKVIGQCPQTTTFLKRKENRSGIEPRSFRLPANNALPLGHTGSLDAAGQRPGFNTLDNWGHKTPTQSKRNRTGKKRLNGHGPKHVYNTLGYIYIYIIANTF